jgi:hypothetical protein
MKLWTVDFMPRWGSGVFVVVANTEAEAVALVEAEVKESFYEGKVSGVTLHDDVKLAEGNRSGVVSSHVYEM